MPPSTTDDPTLHLPRILCLHGGGTNARIFKTQCRGLIYQLQNEFRLVFAEAPFPSEAGPDVLSVYSEWGPFKRWHRWKPEHPELPAEEIIKALDESLENAIRQDNERGGTGEWVALLGFSQGAKVSASLLYRQQVREALGLQNANSIKFRFGILLAGRGPLISLDPDLTLSTALPDASQITDGGDFYNRTFRGANVLRIPTSHVHGLRDIGLSYHRRLYEDFCDPDSRRLIEWDGDHRVPIKAHDVGLVVRDIRDLARETGVYTNN